MASPNAANSKWVHREVEHWLATKGAETLLIVLTAGDIAWDETRGDFDWAKTTALPDVLKGRFADEPLHVDLRNWGKVPNELSLRNDHFAEKVLRLAAPLHGKQMDELSVQAVREVNRRIRHARIAMAVIAVLAVTAGTAAVGFWTQRDQALTALAQSNSHELAARARVTSLERSDLAIVLAMRSIDLARASGVSWTEGASALRDIMAQTHGSRAYCLQGSQSEGRAIDFSESRRLVAVGTEAGVVCIFRRGDDNSLRLLDTLQSFHEKPLDDVHFSADGEWLVTHLWGGALRALHVGEFYGDANPVQQGQANYRFNKFGDTDTAKALSFDAERSRIAFFSSASQKIEIWPLLNLDPDHGPAVTLDPGGHALATAFDSTGMYFAALVLDRGQDHQNEPTWQFWEPETRDDPKFHVKVWLLATQAEIANFEVIAERQGIYFGDGISMGSLRGLLRLGPEARWVAPAIFLNDQHSLERRLVAQVIRVAGVKVLANFMEGDGDRSFDGWRRVTDIGFTNDGEAFFALNDSVVRFWSFADPAQKGEKPRRLIEYITPSASAGARKAQGVVSALSLSADGRLLAALDSADSLTIWDIKAGLAGGSSAPLAFVVGIGPASRGTPTALRFDADARTIAFAAGGGEVRLCDVRNRCGSAAPRQAAAPAPGGGQWKDFAAPEHGQWIAAVAESQVVSFFHPNDLSRPFFQAAASDTPAPVVSRAYAILSGTPGRPVAVISSADGAWAAIFERQQYGFNEKLRLVRLKDRPQVFDVELASKGCADRFSTVAFDLFTHSLAILARSGCVAFVKLPEGDELTTSRIEPLMTAHVEFEVESLSFSKNYILASGSDKAQLWEREGRTRLPDHSLLGPVGGVLLLPPDEKSIIAVAVNDKDAKQAASAAPFAGVAAPIKFVPFGDYSFVTGVAISPDGALLVIVGKRNDSPQETVAAWKVGALDRPLIEHALR
jgi:WD40 repeat protein